MMKLKMLVVAAAIVALPAVGHAQTADSTAVSALPGAARQVAAREARILAVARGSGCTAEKLVAIFADVDGIH